MNKSFNTASYDKSFSFNSIEEIRASDVLDFIGSGKSVLDLGCFDGSFMERIRANKNEVVGIEIADKAIEKARKKGFEVYDLLLEGNWSEKVNKNFDVVFAGEIIEHIFDTDNFLQNIKNVLKNDGQLVLSTPNIASLGRRLLFLVGKSPLVEITARNYDAGHIRYFTIETLKKLLAENGFNVSEIRSNVVNFSNDGKFYSKILAKFFPSLGNNLIVKAKK